MKREWDERDGKLFDRIARIARRVWEAYAQSAWLTPQEKATQTRGLCITDLAVLLVRQRTLAQRAIIEWRDRSRAAESRARVAEAVADRRRAELRASGGERAAALAVAHDAADETKAGARLLAQATDRLRGVEMDLGEARALAVLLGRWVEYEVERCSGEPGGAPSLPADWKARVASCAVPVPAAPEPLGVAKGADVMGEDVLGKWRWTVTDLLRRAEAVHGDTALSPSDVMAVAGIAARQQADEALIARLRASIATMQRNLRALASSGSAALEPLGSGLDDAPTVALVMRLNGLEAALATAKRRVSELERHERARACPEHERKAGR